MGVGLLACGAHVLPPFDAPDTCRPCDLPSLTLCCFCLLLQALSVRPPVGAFGALISGYQSQGELRRLLATYRRFLGLGGLPHTRMLNMVVRSCLAAGETKVALQAVRAAQLVGLQVDVDKYRAWAQQYAAAAGAGAKHPAAASRAAAPSAADDYDEDADEPQAPSAPVSSATSGHQEPAANKEMERFKWWMGLPNKYYS